MTIMRCSKITSSAKIHIWRNLKPLTLQTLPFQTFWTMLSCEAQMKEETQLRKVKRWTTKSLCQGLQHMDNMWGRQFWYLMSILCLSNAFTVKCIVRDTHLGLFIETSSTANKSNWAHFVIQSLYCRLLLPQKSEPTTSHILWLLELYIYNDMIYSALPLIFPECP